MNHPSFTDYTGPAREEISTFIRNRGNVDILKNSSFCNEWVNDQLRSKSCLKGLKYYGAYFTGDALAKQATKSFKNTISRKSRIVDIACGAGSLLLAISKYLQIEKDLETTLRSWNDIIIGIDINPDFVEATRLRIMAEAMLRGANPTSRNFEKIYNLLTNIRVGDGLEAEESLRSCTHIVVNPPFAQMSYQPGFPWGIGRINGAAVFMDYIVKNAPYGCYISAILPEVLRAGSRYAKWRTFIDEFGSIKLTPYGRFDDHTDVDVFLLRLHCGEKGAKVEWLDSQALGGVEGRIETVGDHFQVSTGPVVPHRDPEVGPLRGYICAKTVPPDSVTCEAPGRRRYKGRVVDGPFVVIRRTSSPSDLVRARASIIICNEPLAVENHLLILRPKSGKINKCKKLIQVLGSDFTNKFLNARIRCRHLTIAAVREIPWTK